MLLVLGKQAVVGGFGQLWVLLGGFGWFWVVACFITNAAARRTDGRNKQVTFKNCVPFTNYISQINNTQEDNAEYCDADV